MVNMALTAPKPVRHTVKMVLLVKKTQETVLVDNVLLAIKDQSVIRVGT